MDYIMRMAILVFFLQANFCLNGQIDLQNTVVKYKIDETDYYTVTFTLVNESFDSSFIWLSKEDVSELSDIQKAKSYFLKIREDLSLLNLITEQQIKRTDTPIIYKTFLKILPPNGEFSIDIICQGDKVEKTISELFEFFKNHLVCIKFNKINFIPIINQNEYPFYQSNSLILNECFVKRTQ